MRKICYKLPKAKTVVIEDLADNRSYQKEIESISSLKKKLQKVARHTFNPSDQLA